MSGHTPGPWQVGDCDQGRNIIVTEDGKELLGVDPGDFDREAFVVGEDADLRLMAAAPDLLDALEAYHARHKCGCGHPACNDCERDRTAEAALAKVRGES